MRRTLTVVNGNGKVRETRGWMSLGAEGFCYDVSDSFVQMLGVPKSSFLVNNWFQLIYIEDRQVVRELANLLQKQHIPYPVRMRWLTRSLDPIWLESRFLKRRDRRTRCGEDRIVVNVRRIDPESV